MSRHEFSSMGLTLLVALCGGGLFTVLHLPMAWMLGSMSAIILWNLLRKKRPLTWKRGIRNLGMLLMGVTIGMAFTRETAFHILQQLPFMLLTTVLLLLFCLLCTWFLKVVAGLSWQNGLLGSIPGGLSQMVALSEETKGADASTVTFMQTIRVLCVLLMVPFVTAYGLTAGGGSGGGGELAASASPAIGTQFALWLTLPWYTYLLVPFAVWLGVWGGRKIHLPVPHLVGTIFAVAALVMVGLHVPPLPSPLVTIAQLLLGIHFGLQFRLESIPEWKRLGAYALISNILLILFSFGLSFLYVWLYPYNLSTSFLALAPGGVAEMGAVGVSLGADLAVISSFQLFRVLAMMLAVAPLLQWYLQRRSVDGVSV